MNEFNASHGVRTPQEGFEVCFHYINMKQRQVKNHENPKDFSCWKPCNGLDL